MSTSKYIDIICVAAVLIALLLTVLFINGSALGLTPIADGDSEEEDSQFTANDLNGDWSDTAATHITLTGDGGRVSGSGAYLLDGSVYIIYPGRYVLSGELTGGSVIIDASKEDKVWLLLDGVSLHREDSAAIVVEQAKKVFLTLADGTENVISCGAQYSAEAMAAGIDGAVWSRDDLTVNGEGSLTVTAPYKHGIVCNDDLVIAGGTIHITAAKDGVHVNDSVSFTNADLTIYAGDDGITVSNDETTSWLYIESGTINIPSCYEGLEADDITIAGGVIDIRPTDDGINAAGWGGNSLINITGGDITIINETGRDADGLDSNGSIYVSGGNVFISVNTSSCALDYGGENGGVCKISGGTVIAAGGSAMAEGFDASSEQCFIMYNTSTSPAGTAVTLTNSAGAVLVSETIPCGFSSIVLSTPELKMGETCTISIGGRTAELTVDNSSFGGMGGFGGGWGGQQGGRGDKGGRWGMDSGSAEDSQTPNLSTLSEAGPGGRGGMVGDGSQAPGGGMGGFGGGQQGGFPGGEQPDDGFPGGNFGGGPPDAGSDSGLFDGPGGDRFAQWGQNQDQVPGSAPEAGAAVSPELFLAVGVSALFLLAGLAFAFKVKH